MSIDAYDVLGLPLDCKDEEVKKAYHKLSLQCHPDKVLETNKEAAQQRFNEIKNARDILQDSERRKVYDTFGVDLGEERPEMEVWTIGSSTLLSPMAGFVLKTVVARLIFWLIGWRWIGRILMFLGFASAGLYYGDVSFGETKVRSPEIVSLLLNVGIIDVVIIINWIWPLLAEGISVFYLITEVTGIPLLVESWKIGIGAGFVSLFLAWLCRGWWFWIMGLEVLFAVVLLIALTISSGVMRLWIEHIQAQHGDKLKEHRLKMRAERKALQDEIEDLKRKLQAKGK